MAKQDLEILEFHRDCQRELDRISFDSELKQEMYAVYKSIGSTTRNKICKCCMYNDKIRGICLNDKKTENKMKDCWKANNIRLLKKAGLYGQKRTD